MESGSRMVLVMTRVLVRRPHPSVSGFEDGGRDPQARQVGWLPVTGKGQETGSSLELLEAIGRHRHLDFISVRPISDFRSAEL